MPGGGAADFAWAVGIEDTFIPQLGRSTGRLLDEYALTQHYERWRQDLDLAASLGSALVGRFPAHVTDTLGSVGSLARESSRAWERTR